MSATHPDVARLQPTPDSLNVILKNTHFKDNLLNADSKVQFKIVYERNVPVLVFKFPEPYYDFLEVLKYNMLEGSNPEWMNKEHILIKLVLSDPTITDRLTTKEFTITSDESAYLRSQLCLQKNINHAQFHEVEDYVYSKADKFLF